MVFALVVNTVPVPTVMVPEMVTLAPSVRLAVPLSVMLAIVPVITSCVHTVLLLMVSVPVTVVTAPVAVPPPLKVRLT
jgi:hypothetical protein